MLRNISSSETEQWTLSTGRIDQWYISDILSDEIEDEEFLEFAIDNLSEIMGYIAQGYLNIRIHRDITGEMQFGMDKV